MVANSPKLALPARDQVLQHVSLCCLVYIQTTTLANIFLLICGLSPISDFKEIHSDCTSKFLRNWESRACMSTIYSPFHGKVLSGAPARPGPLLRRLFKMYPLVSPTQRTWTMSREQGQPWISSVKLERVVLNGVF